MIATNAITRIRPRFATTTAATVATIAAIRPPRDSVAPRPSTRITHIPASASRPKRAAHARRTDPPPSRCEGTMPAAR